VEESVFESLTKEYELAKVEEVKEIPTVKVLDSPNIPEKKSFPPRLLITLLGTSFALAIGMTLVFGKTAWDATDASDPRKALAREVFAGVKAWVPRFAQNGSGNHASGENLLGEVPQGTDKDDLSVK